MVVKPGLPLYLNFGHPIAKGLTAFFPLNEGGNTKVHDYSGHRHIGTATNSPGWVNRQAGRGVDFSPTNSYITVPDSPVLRPTGAMTVMAFYHHTGSLAGYLVGKIVSDFTYGLEVSTGAQQITFDLNAGGARTFVRWPSSSVGGGLDPILDRPVMVVGTYDGAFQRIFINGDEKTVTAHTGAINSNTDAFGIGARGGSGSEKTTAIVYSVAIWDRALQASEIRDLWADPWILFRRRRQAYTAPAAGGGGGVSGTIATTDATDTAAFSASQSIFGTIAASDAADTPSISGSESFHGVIAATDEADNSTFSGLQSIQGAIAATDATDTTSIAGTESVPGTMAATDATDTTAFEGSISILAALTASDEADTFVIAGSESILGAIGVTDAEDTGYFTSSGTLSGEISATDANDTATFAGVETFLASITVQDATDTMVAQAVERLIASLTPSDTADTLAASGSVSIHGAISATDGADTWGNPSTISGERVRLSGAYTTTARAAKPYNPTVRFAGPYDE